MRGGAGVPNVPGFTRFLVAEGAQPMPVVDDFARARALRGTPASTSKLLASARPAEHR
jgi:hypothetical protein